MASSDIYLSSKLTDIITLVLFYNTQISLFSYTKVHCFCLYNVLLWLKKQTGFFLLFKMQDKNCKEQKWTVLLFQ